MLKLVDDVFKTFMPHYRVNADLPSSAIQYREVMLAYCLLLTTTMMGNVQ